MSRHLPNGVIHGVCELMSETEVPEPFSMWGGISCISAALGRTSFIDQGHYTVYPNLYIVLVADSAKCRKSTMISTVNSLLREVRPELHLMSQKSTPEALIEDMCGYIPDGDSRVVNSATGIVIADEVSTFIDRNSFTTGMIPILTKLYDCQDFDYRTRSHGVELVENPCLSILGGSTIQWIKEAIPVVSIGGGFTARVIFVYQESPARYVPWCERSSKQLALRENIIHDLCEIRQNVRGAFAVTQKAKECYCSEYIDFCEHSKLFNDPNTAGYAGRRHVMVLKLAMVWSTSMSDSREISEQDMSRAINSLCIMEANMPKVLAAISSEPCGDLSEQLVQLIAKEKRVSRFELVRRFRHKLTVRELDELLKVLEEAHYIIPHVDGSNIIYEWSTKK